MVRNRGGSVLSLKVMTKVSLTKEEDNMKRKADFEQEFIDPSLHHRFAFRYIRPEEADQAAKIEEICFPPNEACSVKMMKERVAAAPDFFLVAADRETGRLRLSLAAAQGPEEKVCFLHYPPLFGTSSTPEILEVMKEYGVRRCYYGHLHGKSIRCGVQGEVDGIQYRLTSADGLGFCPLKI